MDNHYVPNLTFGPSLCKAIHQTYPDLALDTHLMTENIQPLIKLFIEGGSKCITIHHDQTKHLHRSILDIKKNRAKGGIALNPATPISAIECILDEVDKILVMSVNPGFGGQNFIKNSLKKIETIKNIVDKNNYQISIAVDGGIDLENISSVKNAGADTFVIGSAITKTDNYPETIQKFKHLLQ